MDFDDHEDREDQEIEAHEPPEDYSVRQQMRSAGGDSGSPAARKSGSGGGGGTYRYRECLKNHAVSMGGHAVDGCGEFMPAGEDGTLNALKCAACNCHRNFHRKESDSGRTSTAAAATTTTQYHIQHHHQPQVASYYRSNPMAGGYLHVSPPPHHQQRPLALPSISRDDEDMSNPSSSGGGSGSGSKKRFRTKFSHEQKEKMLLFAEKIGWRIQKSDEAELEQFCAETGVKRQVLKVWMHNNKHTLGKKP